MIETIFSLQQFLSQNRNKKMNLFCCAWIRFFTFFLASLSLDPDCNYRL